MRIFKNKAFSKWASKENLDDESLRLSVDEMNNGLIDADLGGHVYKKRIAIAGHGKSGGIRTLLVYKAGTTAYFIYGFAKNARANVKDNELKGLKTYAGILLNYSAKELNQAVKTGALIEVINNG
jgi:hypothetical protein